MPKQKNIACLGPNGSYSEAAARYLFPQEAILLCPTIANSIDAVGNGQAALCVVPIENALEGSINVTLDNLSDKNSFSIVRELVWPIRNHLLSLNATTPPRQVLSHPQALAQCRENLRQFYPSTPLRETSSTSEAAALAAQDKELAALASPEAAEIYKLTIRRADMQDNSINCTRFVVLCPATFTAAQDGAVKTSIACELDGSRSGVLCELLKSFAVRDINLVRIESRPARTALGRYLFFLDLDGSTDAPAVEAALAEIKAGALWLKILGSYPVIIPQG